MNAWWIAYGDRTLYSDDPWIAPTRDVQAVVVRDAEHGWSLEMRGDFFVYLHQHDTWRAVDWFGALDYMDQPGPRRVLAGRTMFDCDFHGLIRWLQEHPDLPLKTGWRPGE